MLCFVAGVVGVRDVGRRHTSTDNIVVVYELPKLTVRVRFPVSAFSHMSAYLFHLCRWEIYPGFPSKWRYKITE